MDLKTFSNLQRVTAVAPHPAGTHAIATVARLDEDRAKRISELWMVPLGDQAASPERLDVGEQGAQAPAYDSAGVLYFLSKRATPQDVAKEIEQVWAMAPGGVLEPLTDEPLGVLEFRVTASTLVVLAPVRADLMPELQRATHREQSKNGPSARVYRDMNVRSWDHWLGGPGPRLISYDLVDGKAVGRCDLCPDFDQELAADHGLAWDLSADGTLIAAACQRPGPDRLPDSSVLLIDTATREHQHLGKSERFTHESVRISPSARTIAAVRHIRKAGTSGPLNIALYDRQGGDATVLAPDWECSPTLQDWHGDEALLVTSPMAGHVPVYEVSLGDHSITRLTAETAGGTHSHVRGLGDTAIGLRHTLDRAPEVFCVPLGASETPKLLSSFTSTTNSAVRVESLECTGAGGTPIHYFVLSPAPAGQAPARPTLLWIHGGPVSSWTDGWHWRWNPLPFVEAGYNIALPNPRGSTGYGQDFIEGIANNQWGDACFRDLMAVTDALCAREDVDPDRLIAMGGSFGGYMSNWIGTQTDRFAAIITHASLYRLSAFHGTTDWPAYWAHDMGLYPSDDPEQYDRYSPHRYVDQWKTPVLITHGENDYRVPISEALMLFEDLRRRNVDARLLVYPDENHWILRPRNSEHWYRSCLEFLSEHAAP